jgi:hypothetical protein
MNNNLGNADRLARVLFALAGLVAVVAAPLALLVKVVIALNALYLLGSSLAGTCLGYRLIGVSTCPVKARQAAQ